RRGRGRTPRASLRGRSWFRAAIQGREALPQHRRRLTIFLFGIRARRHAGMHAELLRDLETRVRVEHAVALAQVALGPAAVGGEELVSTPTERERHRGNEAAEQPQIGAEVRDVERRIAQSSLVQIDYVRP